MRHELGRDVARMFAELTGLELHLLTAADFVDSPVTEPARWCPEARQHRAGGREPRRLCVECVDRIWRAEARRGRSGVFVGACGRRNCSLSLKANDGGTLRLVIQQPLPASDGEGLPEARERAGGRPREDPEFNHAAAWLRLVARGLESAIEVEELKRTLEQARRVQRVVMARDLRLQGLVQRRLPELSGKAGLPEATSQAIRLVEQVRRYLLQNYHRPIGLNEAAAHVRRTPSYVSGLFARETGGSLHAYLQELRLTKAQELLRDPCRTVAEIAAATGYASAGWFRHAFKKHVGLSPSEWRQSRCSG